MQEIESSTARTRRFCRTRQQWHLLNEFCILRRTREQLFVLANSADLSLVQMHDQISVLEVLQLLGRENHRLARTDEAFDDAIEYLVGHDLRTTGRRKLQTRDRFSQLSAYSVDRRERFVEQINVSVGVKRSGQRHTRLLPAAEPRAAFADDRLVALNYVRTVLLNSIKPSQFNYLRKECYVFRQRTRANGVVVTFRIEAALEYDIAPQSGVQQPRFLRNERDRAVHGHFAGPQRQSACNATRSLLFSLFSVNHST